MDKITADDENIFGALKLIEQLYLDGDLPGYVFRNILNDFKDTIDITDFKCYSDEEIKQRDE